MNRTKPNFRATREIVGLSQSDMADLVGVSTTAVKRWEHPDGPQPPADAWDELESWLAQHDDAVRQTVDLAADLIGKTKTAPTAVTLPYWRSQAEYDASGRDPGFYGVINARSREIAQELRRQGIAVEFISADERGLEADA